MNKNSTNKKQVKSREISHSEQRKSKTPYTDLIEEMFNAKKGRGTNEKSKKNLIPFKKGQSGNPGGRPTKYSKLKSALDNWADDETSSDFLGLPPSHVKTMKDRVHWRIWDKAANGDIKCIEILAKLGCLDN
jgi:hypothetical protein